MQFIEVRDGCKGCTLHVTSLIITVAHRQIIMPCRCRHKLPQPDSFFRRHCIKRKARFHHRKIDKEITHTITSQQALHFREYLFASLQGLCIKDFQLLLMSFNKSEKFVIIAVRFIYIKLMKHIRIRRIVVFQCQGMQWSSGQQMHCKKGSKHP